MKRLCCLLCVLLVLPLAALGEAQMARRPDINQDVLLDPPYDFDPETMLPREFGPYYENDYPTGISEYLLLPGTELENTVTVLQGAEEGPVLYVIAGVHGGEIAAWMAGNLLKKIGIKAGTLYILSPANPWGAAMEPRSRYVKDDQDLNRSFPGDPNGNEAQRVAHAIYTDVQDKSPVFVFDLHEAATNKEGRDFLGHSLIYTTLNGIEDMYLDMLLETQLGLLTSTPFDFFAPGPIGSVNNTIANQLGIPVITVETYRADPMEVRISDQLAVTQYVLRHYGLVE